MASKSKKRPPTSIIPGDDARRWREGVSTQRDAEVAPSAMPFFTCSTMLSKVCLDWPGMDGIGTTSFESSWMKMGCMRFAGVRKFSRTIDRTPADFLFLRGRCIWLTQASPLLFVSTAALAPSVGW